MQDNSKTIKAFADIARFLRDHPETMRGNSTVHYCYHKALEGLRAIEPQNEEESRAISFALDTYGIAAQFDNTQASAEGWSIIEAHGVPTIQRDDMAGFFEDDREVWAHIAKNAPTSEYHANALRFIKRENKEEYAQIAEYLLSQSLNARA